MRWQFSRKKFLSLLPAQQHKKCSDVLRSIYTTDCEELWRHGLFTYAQLCSWMGLLELSSPSPQVLADRYHYHLQYTGRGLKEHNLLPQQRRGDHPCPRDKALCGVDVYLDQLRSAHNVGSIVRSFEAFQLGTLILSPQTPGLEHKQVIDASMGCASHVSWERCAQAELLNGPLIAIETSPQSESLQDFVFPEKFTLILGNEEYGCREDSLAAADAIIEIPLVGRKNSLNVANAFAIVAWEISRQLREK